MRKVVYLNQGVNDQERMRVKEMVHQRMEDMTHQFKLQMVQELIPLGVMLVSQMLEDEVISKAGVKYQRNGQAGYSRWGKQPGSVYVGEQKVKIRYPRMRDRHRNEEVELQTYRELQNPRNVETHLLQRVMHGISCRNYQECAQTIPETFGLSRTTVSKRFIRASKVKLQALRERRLDKYDIVAMFIDGKHFQEDEMIVALGITITGEKVVLGFEQTGTENVRVGREFIRHLKDRGLRTELGLLCVIDGSKAFSKSIREELTGEAVIQRCQWHKRENVVSYLPKELQDDYRHKLQAAYQKETYTEAKQALTAIRREMHLINESAVGSLDEGLEETLTLHRLSLFKQLGKSFKTTNIIESVLSVVEAKVAKVSRWKNSNQKQRWLATVLLDTEPRLNRISGHACLPLLREAIQKELKITFQEEALSA